MNEEHKTSPSPWVVEHTDEGKVIYITDSTGWIVTWQVSGEADANLIAAAPELLEVLEEIVNASEYELLDGGPIQKAKAAIAKAKGESE